MTYAINGYKECPGCKQSLEATEEFWSRSKSRKDGWHIYCKDCNKKQKKIHYEAHKEEIAKQKKIHYEAHKEEIAKHGKKYYEAHKEEIKACQRERNKTPKARERAIKRGLKKKYGLTLEQYNAMLEAQGGVCAICHKPETAKDSHSGVTKRLAVDHDHETGKVRKLLCTKCNRALGWFDDNIELFKAFIAYLEEHKGEE